MDRIPKQQSAGDIPEPVGRGEAVKLLTALPGWELGPRHIRRKYTFASFREAIAFVNRVADLAEAEGHHPDISIEYRAVTLAFTTHAIGGLSRRDFAVAARMDAGL